MFEMLSGGGGGGGDLGVFYADTHKNL